jgi:hypothetical protein
VAKRRSTTLGLSPLARGREASNTAQVKTHLSKVPRVGTAFLVLFAGVALATATPVGAATNPWPQQVVNGFATPTGHGFWLVYANGAVTTSGDAQYHGGASGLALNGPVKGGAVAPSGTGYWLVAYDGGIFTYGAARFYGSMGASRLNQPVFSMAATKTGHGYWLVARDGGIFSFGDAKFHGSTGNLQLNQPIDGITTSPTGKGYRMVALDGGIFSFGDVPFYGSLPGRGVSATDVVGMAPTPTNKGYWIARSGGQVYAFGDAKNVGSYASSVCDPVAAIFSNPKAPGYRLVLQSGATRAFGSAPGGAARTGTPRTCTPTSSPALLALTIAAQTHQSSYDRDADFGGWISQHGCQDTRATVLIRTSQAPVTFTSSSNCTVKTGRWTDPWSGAVTTVAHDFQIDHTVPLANAWDSGAWSWSQSQRVAYANDLVDQDHLVPILASENESKGADGPDQWKPPSHGAWCRYALVWDHIKAKWHLSATASEWAALEQMAATC